MTRLTLPYRECPECRTIHAARVCHICKTPIAAVPLDAEPADDPQTSSPDVGLSPAADVPCEGAAGNFLPGRRAA